MVDNRIYTTRRYEIVLALCEALKVIDGTGEYLSNLEERVLPTLRFWDEIEEFPAVHINSGTEYRDYKGGGYKDRFLSVSIKVYVKEENAPLALDKILEDIETVIENNSSLDYYDKRGAAQCVHQISISSIETDEGILDPLGMADMSLLVHY